MQTQDQLYDELLDAIMEDSKELVEKYIAKGADVNAGGKGQDQTVLSLATIMGNKDIVEILVNNPAIDLNKKDCAYNSTALHYAAIEGKKLNKVSYLLIDAGADVNSLDYLGSTALHHAVSKANIPLVKELINKGADTNIKNNKGKTALDLIEDIRKDINNTSPDIINEGRNLDLKRCADLIKEGKKNIFEYAGISKSFKGTRIPSELFKYHVSGYLEGTNTIRKPKDEELYKGKKSLLERVSTNNNQTSSSIIR